MIRRPLVLTALVLSPLVLPGCGPEAPPQEVDFRLPVEVRRADVDAVEDRIVATGTLRARETADLTAPELGVLEIARDASGDRLGEGDPIAAGQLVATVVSSEDSFAARQGAAEQRLRVAERELEARQRLYDEGLISLMELQKAETELAEARLQLERSRLLGDRTRLVSPISGVLVRLARSPDGSLLASGQQVAPGLLVARIAAIGELMADLQLVGPDVTRVAEGDPVTLRYPAWPERSFAGSVVRIGPVIDPVTRAFQVEVAVPGSAAGLRPGMFVEATIVAERREQVVVVPREAVVHRDGEDLVFVLDGQRVTSRAVTVGLGDDRRVEVRDGLAAGEVVVVRGAQTLVDGTRVRATGV